MPVDVEVQVVVSLATWLGLDREPGLLRGYGAIDADTLTDIVTTAQSTGATTSLRRLFCDPTDGRLVQMDSTARRFTGTLRQFTTWRDHTDRLTGDTIADIDHIHDHHHGGPTAAHNGQGLSRRSHTLKDHPRVHAKTKPDRPWGDGIDSYRTNAPDIDWTLPNNTTHTSRPPPALGPGSDPTDHTRRHRMAHLAPRPAAPAGATTPRRRDRHPHRPARRPRRPLTGRQLQFRPSAGVAQLAAHLSCKQEVGGSSPPPARGYEPTSAIDGGRVNRLVTPTRTETLHTAAHRPCPQPSDPHTGPERARLP